MAWYQWNMLHKEGREQKSSKARHGFSRRLNIGLCSKESCFQIYDFEHKLPLTLTNLHFSEHPSLLSGGGSIE